MNAPANINDMVAELLKNEGGYVNNPSDPGGETNFGVTIAVARANGYSGSMRNMTRADALAIYRQQYFHAPKFDDVFAISPAIAAELFDTGVNMGPAKAAQFLQRALNAFMDHCLADGQIGPGTIATLKAFLAKRPDGGEEVLLKAMNCLQGERYIELAEKNANLKTFTYGWISNRVSMSL
jgi:lysozyme family protein